MKTLEVAILDRQADVSRPASNSIRRSFFARTTHLWMLIVLAVCGLWFARGAMAGTWTPLTNLAPDNIDTMLLLTDGTVMAASGITSSGTIGNMWYRLTPDTNGSYVNGTWSTNIPPMNDSRLYYASQVLRDGRLFVAGGEYGSGTSAGEIYDPVNNIWTRLPDPAQLIIDAESRLLPNGDVLVAPVLPNPSGATLIYHVAQNAWSLGGTIFRGFSLDEAGWIKLPDDSILTLDLPGTGTNCERYIPSLNQWVNDADLPVIIWDLSKFEMGPGFLLPDGRAFYLGSSGHTAFYTPSGNTSPGSWVAGPDIPNGQGTPDAPGAMLVTGKILCAVGPNGTVGGATNYPGPTAFYEFDPVANTFTSAGTPTGQVDPDPPFISRMLCLPDGSVLFANTNPQLYTYTPTGNPVASGKPTITSISPNPDGSFHLVGTLLNGISEGAQYGDDAQMNSNYPLVRMTDSKGVVYYARTFGWSSTSVMTGNKSVSTEFSLPAGAPAGRYSLVVVANGISSDPVSFTGSATPNLTVINTTVSGGNGNGIVDFNECNQLFIGLTNIGVTNATTVQATLFTATPGVTVAQATVRYSDIAPGGATTNLSPFEISTAPTFVCGTPITLTLVIKMDQVTESRVITLPTGVPGVPIRMDSYVFTNIASDTIGSGSPLQVTNFNSTLTHVTVSAYVTESFDIDLTLELIAPDGTKVILSQNNGGGGSDYGTDCTDANRTTFDDTAVNSIVNGLAPFVGSYQPQSPLSAYVGKSGAAVNGTWELRAIDPFTGDVGTIECWSLILTPTACVDGGGQCPGADLALGMKATPNALLVQSNLTYTMTITNLGPDTATNVGLSQTLPSSVTFVSATPSQGSASFANGIVSCNLGTMNVGDTASLTVVVKPQTAGTIFSTATVGSAQPDPNLANNTITVSTLVNAPTADLSISLLANPSPVLLNGVLTYTATIINHGPSTASNVMFTNTLPPNVSFVLATASQGSVASSANVVVGSLGTLKSGSNALVTVQVRPLVLGQLTDTASVSSSVTDPVTANNTATATTTVTAASDLVLTMTGPSSVVVGSNINYQLTVQNLGPSPATDVNLRATLPPSVLVLSTNSLNGVITISSNVVSCLVSSLDVNASASLTIVVGTSNLFGSVPVTLVNSGSVTADQADPNTTNNTASLSTLVAYPNVNVVPAGYQLISESYQPTNGMIEPGETVAIALRLQNLGNIDSAPNLTATLLNSGGVVPSGSQVHNYGTLAANGPAGSQTFTFTASGTNGGTIIASLQLQNSGTNLAIVSFPFTLAASNSFASTADIIIPDHGPAIPYPSTNIVSGISGLIGKVTVTFTNFNHTFPDDVDMLLVGPKGQNVLLMSHVGYNGVLSNTSITFDQSALNGDSTPKFLPQSSPILSGSYRPTQWGSVDFFNTFGGTVAISSNNPPPAPQYGTNLNIFNGTTANGPWLLYVFDSSAGDQGIIRGGWSLSITSGNEVNPVVDLAVSGKVAPLSVLEGSNLTYTFTVTNIGPNAASVVQFTNVLPANVSFVSATNTAHAVCATNASGAVYCTFTNLAANSSVTITVIVTPTSAGTLTSVATVTGSDSDPNQSNNSATVTATVTAPVSDLALTMSGPSNAAAGSPVLYLITVTNNGPGAALGVVVTDATQGVLGFLSGSATGSAGQPGLGNHTIVCNVGTLAPGAGAAISLTLVCTQALTFTNTVAATTTSSDTNLANNSASVVTTFASPAPSIVAIGARLLAGPPNGSLIPGQPATVSFSLANIGAANTTNLNATLLATNGVTLPSGPTNYGVLSAGGASVARTFSFTPSGSNGGAVVALLQLADGNANLGTVSFSFNLPATNTFANTATIIIPDHGTAAPYPSLITVSNVAGLISKATVTLSNFTHAFPNDVEVLLAAPSGQNLVLLAHTGGGSSVSNLVLTFDDAASASLPISSPYVIAPLVSGIFQPTDDGLALPFPSPAPGTTSGALLSTFNGIAANGDWALYVFDNSAGDSGSIANGWSLNLATISPVNQAADLGITLTRSGGTLYPGIPVTFTIGITNQGPSTASNVVVTNTFSSGFSFVSTSLGAGNATALGGSTLLHVGTLSVGGSTNFTVSAVATAGGLYTSTVSVGSDQTDINLQDNTAQLGVPVQNAPRITARSGKTNGVFGVTLSVSGQSGTYQVVASTNLFLSVSNWTPVFTTNTASFQFTDTNTASYPRRYYRVIYTP